MLVPQTDTGTIIGAVFGTIGGVALLLGLIYLIYRLWNLCYSPRLPSLYSRGQTDIGTYRVDIDRSAPVTWQPISPRTSERIQFI